MRKETQPPRNRVVIMEADAHAAAALRRIIEEEDYQTAACTTLAELEIMLSDPCMAAIIDIDSVPMDNRTIRTLVRRYPDTCFLCASEERFHPDLKVAIGRHLFACLLKPIDPDELHYFLRCIRDQATDSRAPPRRDA